MITTLLVLSGVASFVLASIVGFQDSRRIANLLFVGISLCFGIWAFSVLLFLQTTDAAVAYVAAKTYYLVAGLFPALLLLFSLVYPENPNKKRASLWVMGAIALVGAIVGTLVVVQPEFVVSGVTIHEGEQVVTVHTATYLLYSFYFISLFLFAMAIALYKFITYRGDLRMQSALYALGILLNSIPGFITNLYLPYFGVYDYVWVGPVMALTFLGLTTYGIVRHGMFSVRVAAVRSTAYAFTLAALLVLYYLIATLVGLMYPNQESIVAFSPINIVITIALVLLFQPIKRFFDKLTNHLFYRDYYTADDFFSRFNRIVSSSTVLNPLLRKVANEVAETVKSEQVFFSLISPEQKVITVGTIRHSSLPRKDIETLRSYSRTATNIIVADLLEEDDTIRRLMKSHKVAMVMPLSRDEVFLGFLCIGYHKVSRYTTRDIKTLRAIADELGIAIQNALSLQEVRDLNAHLEQRIDAATKELRASNAQLQRLDEAKDEFISMASHQLRTPLTSIKGYLSMLIEGDMGTISKEQKQVLNEAFMSSERMVRLIADFLNVSRLQTGKFVIEKHPVDLALLVQHEVNSLKPNAAAREQKFIYRAPKNIPLMELDESKIQQVVMNFADNAIYYSKDAGTITISLKKTKNGYVEFTVKDQGIGVPEKERTQLFNKFFRATNARRARPDGTGVGLFLAKKVIDEHGGEIIFESKEGKGSTFGFRLPLSVKRRK